MRVLRTEFYFDAKDMRSFRGGPAVEENFGIAAAFFKVEAAIGDSLDVKNVFDGQLLLNQHGPAAQFAIPMFLESLFRGIREPRDALIIRKSMEFAPYLDFFNSSTVVVEQSPPTGLEWQLMVKSASSVTIGTYIGLAVAPSGSPLLLLTVPAGIIAVGTAVGISRGLENGLNKTIERLLKNKFGSE